MKNYTALLTLIIVSITEATPRTSYATSTWNPPRFGIRIPSSHTTSLPRTAEPVITDEDIESIGIGTVSQDATEYERLVPASAKAALIAVMSATVIGGVRHVMELVVGEEYA